MFSSLRYKFYFHSLVPIKFFKEVRSLRMNLKLLGIQNLLKEVMGVSALMWLRKTEVVEYEEENLKATTSDLESAGGLQGSRCYRNGYGLDATCKSMCGSL